MNLWLGQFFLTRHVKTVRNSIFSLFYFSAVLGPKPRASHMLGKHPDIELSREDLELKLQNSGRQNSLLPCLVHCQALPFVCIPYTHHASSPVPPAVWHIGEQP